MGVEGVEVHSHIHVSTVSTDTRAHTSTAHGTRHTAHVADHMWWKGPADLGRTPTAISHRPYMCTWLDAMCHVGQMVAVCATAHGVLYVPWVAHNVHCLLLQCCCHDATLLLPAAALLLPCCYHAATLLPPSVRSVHGRCMVGAWRW